VIVRFNRLLKDAQARVPNLEVNLEVGDRSEFPNPRDYAYCEHFRDNTIRIVVAPDFEQLPPITQEAILRHELAHAIEFALGLKRTNYEFGPLLARTPERRADQIAELVWDEPILYDTSDLQTLGQGVYPRPERLGL
jgi:hypothetical protein